MTIVKVQHKGQMTIPRKIRSQVGLADGDLIEVKATGGKIILTPRPGTGVAKSPRADDEYTPEQRQVIDARLAESERDLKAGRTFGPFDTAEEMIASMSEQLGKRASIRKARRA